MSNSNLDDKMDDAYWEGVKDHPYIGEDPETISLLEQAEHEQPRIWIGRDRAVVERKPEKELHWSERAKLGYKPSLPEEWELGDQMADHSDDQGYDEWEEDDE